MGLNLRWIEALPPIGVSTINSVPLLPGFAAVIYLAAIGVWVLGAAVYRRKGYPLRPAIAKAAVCAFFASGLAYAFLVDLGWAAWVKADLERFAGLGPEAKLLRIDGALYDVSREARRAIRRDYVLLGGDAYSRLRTEYLLLPLRRRDRAERILVLPDPVVRCEFSGAEPIFFHSSGACLLGKR